MTRIERFEAVVVGAGQAGLAAAFHLAQHGIDFTVVTSESRIGDNWRRRWDSLRLFTPARYSGLPGMPFPAPPNHFPDKDEVADYLERYADRFDLPVRLDAPVRRMTSEGNRFQLFFEGSSPVVEAANVVVATGAFQSKSIPTIASSLAPSIHQLHSSAYRNPFELPDGPVLVVGAGNSGAQIALELGRSRKVWLAGRGTGSLPRRLLGRDLFDWAWPVMTYATKDTRVGRRLSMKAKAGGDSLIGISSRELADAGVLRVPRLETHRGGLPVCGDQVLEPKVIVWSTGFAADYRWIDLPVFDGDGAPRHTRGVSTARGLYFLGLRFQHRMTSSLVGGVGADAEFLAEQIAARCDTELDCMSVVSTRG